MNHLVCQMDIIYCFLTMILWLLIAFNVAMILSILMKVLLSEENYNYFYSKITQTTIFQIDIFN